MHGKTLSELETELMQMTAAYESMKRIAEDNGAVSMAAMKEIDTLRKFVQPPYEDRLGVEENRITFSTPQQEIAYLRERIHDSKGWMKVGLTHETWGAIKDAWSALPPSTAPSIKKWRETPPEKEAK